MSPELLKIKIGLGTGEFNPELCDIFSLGITFLRFILTLTENEIDGMNDMKSGQKKIDFFLGLFIEEFKDTKFRSEFRKSFYSSVKKQYEKTGRISKKQLEIIKDSFLQYTQHAEAMDKFDERERDLISNLLYDYEPKTAEEREYCINLSKKYWAESKARSKQG